MRRRGHRHLRIKWLKGIGNSLIIGGNDHPLNTPALFGLIHHMLNQRFAGI